MKIRKIASIYSIFMGVSMIGMWLMFWSTGEIPELETEPIRIGAHLAAEFATAFLLITAGVSILKRCEIGLNLFQVSMGMLIYTLIQSPGYFAQQADIEFVVMFGVFMAFALFFTGHSLRNPEEF